MIERFVLPKFLICPPAPAMGIKERAYLECGCQVFVGVRMDKQEVSTMADPCSAEHESIARHFNMLLAESTVEPTDEELVVVCERLLEQSARAYT
jgi:hypothetical protein